jgi:hypothetical protein
MLTNIEIFISSDQFECLTINLRITHDAAATPIANELTKLFFDGIKERFGVQPHLSISGPSTDRQSTNQ